MDRRSWLWRRKSSEKSPGETESTGSISSHSERFSDDQAYATQSTQSPEVMSKAAPNDEYSNESVKTLTDKLSAALRSISAKEDLVKQHAKVAEEAVSGWENAENEVLILKQKLEAANQKNSVLEDRLGHLDGALKECVRQLRQAREEQEQKIHDAVAKKTHEWESLKSLLQSQLLELQVELQNVKTEAAAPIDSDLQAKLEAAEKQNSALKLELLSKAEELEIRIIERDLSTKAAETASKQHLESIKKVAKLEAECRRLKAMARKVSQVNNQKSGSSSSVYVESLTDSQSDSGERLLTIESGTLKMGSLELNECEPSDSGSCASSLVTEHQFRNEKIIGKNRMVPSIEINLMDDFLEMERLAALPVRDIESGFTVAGSASHQPIGGESRFKTKLDAMIQRIAELEDKLEKIEMEKVELEVALSLCEKHLETSQSQLLVAEKRLKELQKQLVLANESKRAAEEEERATRTKQELAESQLRVVENEINALLSKIGSLEEEVQKERALSADNVARCQKMENELLIVKREAENKQEAELERIQSANVNLKIKQEKELSLAADKFAECQKTIASLGQQLKSLASLEDVLLDPEKQQEITTGETKNRIEPQNLHSSGLSLPKRDSEFSHPLKHRNIRKAPMTTRSNGMG
ncbi:hypothetical protein L484_007922 [Morus notabilis]|uniref:Filament-like plant protein 3 n=1 Tax=Morus notabilis TaxID=981085 RepID=W9R0K2_9ROSA|nr:filament-like plant protein [Morus notabilis]XP_024019179.1 filament-like plant protein [Morus notabilis]EXB53551.1 hypothetical protein L484_007922 [Morus notabilis]